MAKKLRDYVPALQYGAKVYPNDIAGMVGLPHVGNIFYVDPGAGSDTANSGSSQDDALDTVAAALEKVTADQDDIVVVAGTSSTGRTAETAVIDWNKRRSHIVGNGAPRRINNRNGIGTSYSGGSTTPVFTVSATNCIFSNISIADFNDNDVLVEVTADYNTFINVHFQGMGHATPAAEAGARTVLVTAAGELEFINCTFGVDTVTRSAANASLELTGSCPRNRFVGCHFPVFTDDAAALWVKADTGNCFERFLIFEDCFFSNASQGSSTAMTVGMDVSTTGNGTIYVLDSWWHGATDLVNNVTNVYINNNVVATPDGGAMIVHANS